MFEDSLFASARKQKTNSPLTIAVSFLLQTIAVGIMVLLPLVYTEALPRRLMTSMLITPPPPPTPRTASAPSRVQVKVRPVRQQQVLTQPRAIPDRVAMLVEEPLLPVISGVVTDQASMDEQVPSTLLTAIITPPPPLPEPVVQRIPVGGVVMAAKLIFQPRPVYPQLARQARIQGTVRLQALISKDGVIDNLTVLSGHPLLIPAALDAVRQWRYQPTMLNGRPVEVETTIDVTFTLGS